MTQTYSDSHFLDENKNPAGGHSSGIGFNIEWQNGPLRVEGDIPLPQNGAFVEEIILACIARVEFYQRSKFNCPENEETLKHLRAALASQNARTADREERGVEGTHQK